MNWKHESTKLFDGLNFETALQLYFAVLAEAQKVEGPAPNLFSRRWPETAEDFEKRRQAAVSHDGYALESFDVAGFRFTKGTGKFEYGVDFVPSEFTEVRNYNPMVIAQFDLEAKSAAFVAEGGFRYVLGVELNSMLPEEGDYRVEVRNVHGQWDTFHRGFTSTLGEAIRIKREIEDGIVTSERGNAFCEARVTLIGAYHTPMGYIWIPPFGDITFLPRDQAQIIDGVRSYYTKLSADTAEKLLYRRQIEEEEITKMWPYIVRHSKRTKWDDPTEFVFEEQQYGIDRGSNTNGDPRSSHIRKTYGGGIGLVGAYQIGLLEAWARAYGYNG